MTTKEEAVRALEAPKQRADMRDEHIRDLIARLRREPDDVDIMMAEAAAAIERLTRERDEARERAEAAEAELARARIEARTLRNSSVDLLNRTEAAEAELAKAREALALDARSLLSEQGHWKAGRKAHLSATDCVTFCLRLFAPAETEGK